MCQSVKSHLIENTSTRYIFVYSSRQTKSGILLQSLILLCNASAWFSKVRPTSKAVAMCWEGIMSMSGTMVKGVGQACLAVFRARFCGYLQTNPNVQP